jgi:hypothetical protein
MTGFARIGNSLISGVNKPPVYQVRQRIFDDFLTAVLKQPSIPAYLLC